MRNMVLYFKREMKQCNRQRCFATSSWSQSNTRTTSIPFDWRDRRVSKPYNRAILKPNHVKWSQHPSLYAPGLGHPLLESTQGCVLYGEEEAA